MSGSDQAKYLVVLGAQMKPEGPSKVLQYRLDAALAYLTELTKRSFAMHYTFEKNKSRKQYNDFNNKIKVINIGYLNNNY